MKYKIIPQQEIFWHQEYTGTYSSNNNIFLVVEVDEIFDQNHLNRCYNKLISEFDVLRSRFYLDNSGSPIFSIQPCNINSIEFSEVKDFQKKSNTICEFIDRKFNFEFPPLVRCLLLHNIKNKSSVIAIVLHHIISDDLSAWILLKRLIKLYKNPDVLKGNCRDFIGYVKNYNKLINLNSSNFWNQKLSTCFPVTTLPFGEKIDEQSAAVINFSIDKKIVIKSASNFFVTPFTISLAVYYLIIFLLTGQKNILISSPFSNRSSENEQEIVGPLAQMLYIPLSSIKIDIKLSEYLKEIFDLVLDILENQKLPSIRNTNSISTVGFSYVSLLTEDIPINTKLLQIEHNILPDKMEMFLEIMDLQNHETLNITLFNKKRLFDHITQNEFSKVFTYLVKKISEIKEDNYLKNILPYSILDKGFQIKNLSGEILDFNLPGRLSYYVSKDKAIFNFPVSSSKNNKLSHNINLLEGSGRLAVDDKNSIVDLGYLEAKILKYDVVQDVHIQSRFSSSLGQYKLCIYIKLSSHNEAKIDKLENSLKKLISGTHDIIYVKDLQFKENKIYNINHLNELPIIDEFVVSKINFKANKLGLHDLEYKIIRTAIESNYENNLTLIPESILSNYNFEDDYLTEKNTLANSEKYIVKLTEQSISDKLSISHGKNFSLPFGSVLTLIEALESTSTRYPNKGITFINNLDNKKFVSYRGLVEQAFICVANFTKSNIKKGDYAVIQIENSETLIPIWLGCLIQGVIPVIVAKPENYYIKTSLTDKLAHVIKTLSGAFVIVESRNLSSIDFLKKNYSELNNFSVVNCDALLDSKVNIDLSKSQFSKFDPKDCAFIQLSAGSTGFSKCIPERHENVLFHIYASAKENNYHPDDILLNWLPLDHVVPIVTFLLRGIVLGCSQVLVSTSLILSNPILWLKLLSEYKATHSWAPNFGYNLIAKTLTKSKKSDINNIDLSHVKNLINAGEMVTRKSIEDFITFTNQFGLNRTVVTTSFGMAECATCMTYYNWPSKKLNNSLSFLKFNSTEFVNLGKPMPGVSIRIVDKDKKIVTEGILGQLEIKGPVLVDGYLFNQEATNELFNQGWLCSGDEAFIYNGYLFVSGRIKELIVINGNKYFCHDIEEKINQIEGINPTFVAVTSVANKKTGSEDAAIVFCPNNKDVKETIFEIKGLVSKQFAINPVYILPIKETHFPKTTSGKIQRLEVKRRILSGYYQDAIKFYLLSIKDNNYTLPNFLYIDKWFRKDLKIRPSLNKDSYCIINSQKIGEKELALSKIIQELGFRPIIFCINQKINRISSSKIENIDFIEISDQSEKNYLDALNIVYKLYGKIGHIIDIIGYNIKSDIDFFIYEHPLNIIKSIIQYVSEHKILFPTFLGINSNSKKVNEDDILIPTNAIYEGIIKAAGTEYNEWNIKSIDLETINKSDIEVNFTLPIVNELLSSEKEPEVSYRNSERYIKRFIQVKADQLVNNSTKFLDCGFYIVAGGAGGIGKKLCKFLLQNGCNVVIIGRKRLQDALTKDFIKEFKNKFIYYSGDIGLFENIIEAVNQAKLKWKKPLLGAFNLSYVYNETSIKDLEPNSLKYECYPKIEGTIALKKVLEYEKTPQKLILFSSIFAKIGGKNIASYISSNLYLEYISDRINSESTNISCHCFNWSLWDNIGMSKGHPINHFTSKMGLYKLGIKHAFTSLLLGLNTNKSITVGLNTTGENSGKIFNTSTKPESILSYKKVIEIISNKSIYHSSIFNNFKNNLVDVKDKFENIIDPKNFIFTEKITPLTNSIEKNNKHLLLIDNYKNKLWKIWSDLNEIKQELTSNSYNFFQNGADSITLTKFIWRINKEFNLSLDTSVFYSYSTINELINFIIEKHKINNDLLTRQNNFKYWQQIHKNDNKKYRLFIFPYLASDISSFYNFKLSNTEIWYCIYPDNFIRKEEIIKEISKEMVELQGDDKDTINVLFGHSFGGILVYEVSIYLEALSSFKISAVIVSAIVSPSNIRSYRNKFLFSKLDNTSFIIKLKEMNIMPNILPEYYSEEKIKILKNHFKMFDEYEWSNNTKLKYPIFAFAGKEDDFINLELIKKWQNYTSSKFQLNLMPGGHMFINNQDILINKLEEILYQLK